MNEREYDPMVDSYESWRAFIEILRQRWLAGEEITGPWAKRPIVPPSLMQVLEAEMRPHIENAPLSPLMLGEKGDERA